MNINLLNDSPKIYTIDDFISTLECLHIIDISKDKLKPAFVSGNKSGVLSQGRTGKNCWIKHNHDTIIQNIVKRISELVGMPNENAESLQVIHYQENQKYEYHYDAFELEKTDKSRRLLRNGGQRLLTCLIYLNNVKEGGETGFQTLNIEIKPKTGKIVVFENTFPNSLIKHPDSLHSGRPVISGEKYAVNLWFRHLPISENFDIDSEKNKLEEGDFIPFI